MQHPFQFNRVGQRIGPRFRSKAAALALLGVIAIAFTVAVIQVQSGATAYLAALSVWSRAQVESVRNGNNYARTGDLESLQQARKWYQIPLGDLQARAAMENQRFDYNAAEAGFLQGGNHPDDVPRMIWLFRLLKEAPYFRDAVGAWRNSDEWVLKLGEMHNRLEAIWQQQPTDDERLIELQQELDFINSKLGAEALEFRQKMSLASRALVTILSVASVVFLIILGALASQLIIRMTAALRSSEHKFRTTFEQAAMGIAQMDAKGRILEANNALCEILKYSRENLLARHYNALIYAGDREVELLERQAVAAGTRDSLALKLRLHCGNGDLVWTQITMSKFDSASPEGPCYICIVEDVSEQHRLSEELSYQARHDNLTGLINRRAFEGYLQSSLKTARSENYVHCLCFIDLDQFKIVNDTLGHFAGDQLLLQVTQQLSRGLRKRDLLARLGGDEFALILDCCEPEAGVKLAEALRDNLHKTPFVWEGRSFNIGCSVGIVPITADSSDEAELLQAADSACHLAKEQGRNRVLLTYQGDKELTARRVQMEWLGRIRHAIETNKFVLHAQQLVPQNPAFGLRIEVLVRMIGEDDEIIAPGAFLPAAERFGLAHLIDRWVIERVCERFKAQPQFMDHMDACHINISGTSFAEKDFCDFTIATLARYKIPPAKLCFEITETAAISNLNLVHDFMARLRNAGSSFALDDFGAGLSSFAYLKQLPVEYLKIDGAFVKNMATDEADRAMVRAISDIGQTLGKVMVAEFVEDQASLDYLREMGVQYAQGYHTHRPQPLVDVMKLAKKLTTA